MLDRGADEVLGRSAYEFIHEDFLYKFGKEFLNRRQSKRGLYEMDLKTRNGLKTPVLCSASPILDEQGEFLGSLSTVTDLRFLKKAQETVKLERDKFHSLAEASPFGLVVISPDGAFEYINPKFIEIFKQNKIDVVICDLVMPGMDGWKVGQAIASICAERGESKTRFILLTGWGGQTMEQELIRKFGVDALLEKPIDIKKLLDTMGKLTVQTTG